MTLVLSPEQEAFRDAVRDFCARECGTREQRDRLTDGGRHGHSQALYDHMAGLARAERLRALACEVNVVPPNPGSRLFHARAGFVTLDELELADGRTVELLTRDLDGAAA